MYKLTRRHVIATLSSSALVLCPAILNAQALDLDWDGLSEKEPIGQDRTIQVEAGPAQIDISDLRAGEVAVIARPTEDPVFSGTDMIQYIAVHHRTETQRADAEDREGAIQDPTYFVVNLVCTHRGKAIGLTGDPDAPFACTDRGSRHSSVYDLAGFGVAGASEGEYLSIPDYTLSVSDTVTLELA